MPRPHVDAGHVHRDTAERTTGVPKVLGLSDLASEQEPGK